MKNHQNLVDLKNKQTNKHMNHILVLIVIFHLASFVVKCST